MSSFNSLKPLDLTQKECSKCKTIFFDSQKMREHTARECSKNTQYYCEMCNTYYESVNSLLEHIKITHPFQCSLCHTKLKNRYGLKNHVAKFHGMKIYKCQVCTFTSVNKQSINLHKSGHKQHFTCKNCREFFFCKIMKKNHRCKAAMTFDFEKYEKLCTECLICGEKCPREEYFTHVKDKHFEVFNLSIPLII